MDRDIVLHIISGAIVRKMLSGHNESVIKIVKEAYIAHLASRASLPHSSFLRFPDKSENRIIALPAAIQLDEGIAGLKWVSSFPKNVNLDLNRASGVIILNSWETGYPYAILEASIISAKRTAASAAVAAGAMHADRKPTAVGLVGCGVVNLEVIRFLRHVFPSLEEVILYDHSEKNLEKFRRKIECEWPDLKSRKCVAIDEVFNSVELISLATTSTVPYLNLPDKPAMTVLHLSLRDITSESLLQCDNVTDDIDHVMRAQTSLHLAEGLTGNREFVRCNLADILFGIRNARTDYKASVFSPFGLGILDIALASYVYELALKEGMFVEIEDFNLSADSR